MDNIKVNHNCVCPNKDLFSITLSMFSNFESSKVKYKVLNNSFKNFNKTAGTHIAKGLLEFEDGMITIENNDNHFELLEYEVVNLQNKFEITEKL